MRSLWIMGVACLAAVFATAAQAQNSSLHDEIMQAFNAISEAYANRDTDTVRSMTADGFIWIASFNGGGRSLDDQLAAVSQGQFAFSLQPLGEMTIESVADDTALQRFHADVSGAFGGEPLPSPVAITLIWLRQDGDWRQRLYQETPIED